MQPKFKDEELEESENKTSNKKDKFKKPKHEPYKRIKGIINWEDKEDEDN